MAFDFIQLADPQFGMFAAMSRLSPAQRTKTWAAFRRAGVIGADDPDPDVPDVDNIDPEIDRFQWAIAEINRRRPAFVVVCGDLVNNIDQPNQAEALHRIAAQLDPGIPIHWLPGNHDLAIDGGLPTPDALSEYRQTFRDDFYTFQHDDTLFLALNSETMHRPEHLPHEAPRQFEFIADSLSSRAAREADRIVAFTHTPLFLRDPDEPQRGTISDEYRGKLFDLFQEHDVEAVLSGHLHHNRYVSARGIRQIVSCAVGFPLVGRSGYRVVHVPGEAETPIDHDYHEFDPDPAQPKSTAE